MQSRQEFFKVAARTLRVNFDVRAAICDGADDFIRDGKIFHEWTETHALHYAENFHVEQNDSPPHRF